MTCIWLTPFACAYKNTMVSRQAVKPGLPYEIHFLLKLKNHGEGLEGSQEFAGIYLKSL